MRKQRNRQKNGDKRKGRNKVFFLENEESWKEVFLWIRNV